MESQSPIVRGPQQFPVRFFLILLGLLVLAGAGLGVWYLTKTGKLPFLTTGTGSSQAPGTREIGALDKEIDADDLVKCDVIKGSEPLIVDVYDSGPLRSVVISGVVTEPIFYSKEVATIKLTSIDGSQRSTIEIKAEDGVFTRPDGEKTEFGNFLPLDVVSLNYNCKPGDDSVPIQLVQISNMTR